MIRAPYLTALSLLLSAPALGGMPAWDPAGVSVCGTACRPEFHLMVADGAGGAYVAWRDSRNLGITGGDTYLQRLKRNPVVVMLAVVTVLVAAARFTDVPGDIGQFVGRLSPGGNPQFIPLPGGDA